MHGAAMRRGQAGTGVTTWAVITYLGMICPLLIGLATSLLLLDIP